MEIGAAGQGIRSGKKMAWDMDDLEIEICKVEQPSCLATVEVLGLTEVRQVLVICEDLDGEGGPMEIVSSGFQGTDNCKELPVIDVVVPLCRNERLREVGTRMPIAVGVCLEENGARGVLRGIGGNGEGFGEVREMEDGTRQEELLKLIEGLLTSGSPVPAIVFLGEV